ncbi:MAG: LuxR C-terminal-related transcriptional regulator [Nitrospira sp.]|jgi:DNA-binding NarL/FixJ family response regulator|nr:LuxR C-terminal-related transcriptional regulator [Nitrospira sp.]
MVREKKDHQTKAQDMGERGSLMTTRVPPEEVALAAEKRRPEDLTPRELQILRLIWDGHTNRGIAGQLNISMKTADTHRSNMMKKLRASNTAQLLKAALEGDLLQAHSGAGLTGEREER